MKRFLTLLIFSTLIGCFLWLRLPPNHNKDHEPDVDSSAEVDLKKPTSPFVPTNEEDEQVHKKPIPNRDALKVVDPNQIDSHLYLEPMFSDESSSLSPSFNTSNSTESPRPERFDPRRIAFFSLSKIQNCEIFKERDFSEDDISNIRQIIREISRELGLQLTLCADCENSEGIPYIPFKEQFLDITESVIEQLEEIEK